MTAWKKRDYFHLGELDLYPNASNSTRKKA